MTRKILGFLAAGLLAATATAGKPLKAKPAKASAAVKPAAAKTEAKADDLPGVKFDEGKPAAKASGPSYESLRDSAQPAGDLSKLLEPLFAECKEKGDFERRQCEQIRAWHLARLRGTKWYAVADATALQPQPYDADAKTLTLGVTGCLSCANPPVIAGSARLIATKAPKSFDDGAPVGLDLGFHDVTLPDAKRAAFWSEKVKPRLRVEFVFNVGAPFDAQGRITKGVGIVPVAHRIYNTCTGEVLASDPPSTERVKLSGPRDPICPPADSPSDEEIEVAKQQAALPDTLSRGDIEKAMQPVQQRVFECGEEFDSKQGHAFVLLEVTGDGKVSHQVQEPYDKDDIGLCIKAAIKEAKFPRFKSSSPPVKIKYPFTIRR